MKITKFEGTPEEFKAVAYIFDDSSSSLVGNEDQQQTGNADEKKNLINEGYRAMLRRIDIPQGQRDLYRVLAKGELEYTEYLHQMKRSVEEIRGLHGALGRRINNTPEIHKAGLPGNMEAVATWRKHDGKNFICLKPDFIEFLIGEELV